MEAFWGWICSLQLLWAVAMCKAIMTYLAVVADVDWAGYRLQFKTWYHVPQGTNPAPNQHEFLPTAPQMCLQIFYSGCVHISQAESSSTADSHEKLISEKAALSPGCLPARARLPRVPSGGNVVSEHWICSLGGCFFMFSWHKMKKKGLRWRQCAKRTSYKVSSSWSIFWTTILLHINLYYKSNSHCSYNQLKPIFNWGIHILRLQCIGYPSESEMHCPVAAQHFWPAQNHTPAMTSGMHHSR